MKHLVMGMLTVGSLLLGLGSAIAAKSDLEKFDAQVGKYAVTGPSVSSTQPKGLCVCQDGGEYDGYAGSLQRYPATNVRQFVAVRCWVQGFDATTGENTQRVGCPTWVPLSK